jgi:WD40 repeat protein
MNIDETDVVRLILSYLKDHCYTGTLRCLEKESGVTECSLPDDVMFLRSLVLDGRWEDVINFVEPLETLETFENRKFRFEIEKQRFLEMLAIRPDLGRKRDDFDVESILSILGRIETSCPSREEYTALCFLLTLQKLDDHPQYRKWDSMTARMELFGKLHEMVKQFFPNRKGTMTLDPSKGRLLNLICNGAMYEKCQSVVRQNEIAEPNVMLSSKNILIPVSGTDHVDVSILRWMAHLNESQFREVGGEMIEPINEQRLSRLKKSRQEDVMSKSVGDLGPGSVNSWTTHHQLHSMQEHTDCHHLLKTHSEIVRISGHSLRPSTQRQHRSLFHRPLTSDEVLTDLTSTGATMDYRDNGCLTIDKIVHSPPATPPGNKETIILDTSTPKDARKSVPLKPQFVSSPVHSLQEDTVEKSAGMDRKHTKPQTVIDAQLPGIIQMPRRHYKTKNGTAESCIASINTNWLQSRQLSDSVPVFKAVASVDDVQAVRAVSFSPKGDFFAVGSNSRTLRVCSSAVLKTLRDISHGPVVLFKRNRYHRGSIYCISWSPKDDIIATGSNDKTIKLMRFDQGHCTQFEGETTLDIHDGTVRDVAFISNTSSLLLLSGGAGNCCIHVTDCSVTPETVSHLTGHIGHVTSLYPWDHHMVASGSTDRYVRLWDLRNSQCILILGNGSDDLSSTVQSVCVSDNNQLLAVALENGQILVYDIKMGRTLLTIPVHTSDCRSVRFAPHTHDLLSSSYDSTISLTNVSSVLNGQQIKFLPHCIAQHNDKVIQSRWHPDGIGFASTSADHTVKVWKKVEQGMDNTTNQFTFRVS